jgi:hypothetical protein
MSPTNRTPLQSALRRLLRDRERAGAYAPGARRRRTARTAPLDPSSAALQRELDWFRRGQGLPYWHHDHRPD